MTCIKTENFRFNRILLLAIGLWPYQQSILVRFQLVLSWTIVASFIVFQLTTFLTTECTPELVIKVLSSFTFFLINVLKFNTFWINMDHVKYLLEKLQKLCDELRDENEVAIMKNHGNETNRYTLKMILLVACNVVTLIVQSTCPQLLNAFLFANESRPRRTMPITTEYFVDREKYFYLILLHTNAAIFIGSIVITATGTTLIGMLKHACGMFKVASYRIQRAMVINISRNANMKNEICKEIIYAVDIHCQAMTFAKLLFSLFEKSFFFLVIVNVLCLSLNLFQIFQILLFERDIQEAMLHCSQAVTICVNVFLACYTAQEITDHNSNVFATIYNARWYVAPLHVQKMLLFLLQRNTRAFHLNIAGVFVVSLENFSTLVSTSVSYFTILYSMWQ